MVVRVGWRKKITVVDTQHDIGNNYDMSPVSCMDKRLFNDCEGIFSLTKTTNKT